MHKHGMPDYQAEVCAAFSQGNFGKAIKLAESQEFNELKNTMVDFVKRAASQGAYEINEIATDIVKSETVNIQDYLDLMTIWFKDVLLYKSTGDNKLVTYQDEIMIIKRQSAEVSFEGLENIFKAIDTCRKRLNANVNNNLTVELLLMEEKKFPIKAKSEVKTLEDGDGIIQFFDQAADKEDENALRSMGVSGVGKIFMPLPGPSNDDRYLNAHECERVQDMIDLYDILRGKKKT
jgi:hypothetical protein